MPFIQINIIEGRTPEKKERLIREVTDKVADILESPVQNVRVMINEMPPEHWGIAGESVKRRNEQEAKGVRS
ncbi:4-oxalocrotonate tautomerase [Bacillus thermotolerans]|uniref:Tautomerase n=1 Tax=Bacillus thermotolerans TaxID=1221996 RepID=A0A0F5I1S0_BACTR|nr:4-oxalocrotonate tautomerase [Bacillus thermotolerans]KKB36933.1 4-oxalocrotonate tautomerase [Bacillus thermotolerans]KKB39584.1 4-oxalocrotonate tautomerase [Bacillus thermotolerans]